jgi:hypothetical protein
MCDCSAIVPMNELPVVCGRECSGVMTNFLLPSPPCLNGDKSRCYLVDSDASDASDIPDVFKPSDALVSLSTLGSICINNICTACYCQECGYMKYTCLGCGCHGEIMPTDSGLFAKVFVCGKSEYTNVWLQGIINQIYHNIVSKDGTWNDGACVGYA